MCKSILAAGFVVILIINLIGLYDQAMADENRSDSYLSLEKLRSSGDDWEVVSLDITDEAGHIRLKHDNWLMYFLHWRPLDSSNTDLSIEYVQNHMLNFWGPSMPFTLTDDTGTTMVGEHKAYYVDGTIYEGAIQTRFIVWNCEETNRQFTADCNINRKMKTIGEKLKTQFEITSTICCHDGYVPPKNSNLPNLYSSQEYKLSFGRPSSWRTYPFETKKWFPDGQNITNGSLWTMMTDSDRKLDLYWMRHDKEISADQLENILNNLVIDSAAALKSPGIISYSIDTAYSNQNQYWAEGKLKWLEDYNGELLDDDCSFIAILGTKAKHDFLILAILTHVNEIWGRTIDLSPSRETFHKFLNEEIMPALGCF